LLAPFYQKYKKISSFDRLHFVTFTSKFIIFFPKYALEDLTIGSGSIIVKGNIEEFYNHISMHKDVEDRS
jgi:hypothetical protein